MSDQNPTPICSSSQTVCPNEKDKLFAKKWAELIGELAMRGPISPMQIDLVSAYCTAYSRWMRAEEKLQQTGDVLSGKNGFYINPFLQVSAKAMDQMQKMADAIGLERSKKKAATFHFFDMK